MTRHARFLEEENKSPQGLNSRIEKAIIDLDFGLPKKRSTMRTLSLSEAKIKLSELVEAVHKRDEEVVITKNGSPAAVLVSPEEYESWQETLLILSDADLMKEIRRGKAGLRHAKKLYTIEELFR